MRIAQIAPLAEAVPPKRYGGTERVVSYLTEELVALGHDVTLFASGDSATSARLVPMWPRGTRLDPEIHDPLAPVFRMLERVRERAGEFDVLHFHLDYLPFWLFSAQPTPFLSTMHGRMDMPEIWPIYEAHSDLPLVSISDAQRRPLPRANWVATVHHGLPERLLVPQAGARPSYLAFLGRISPEKGLDRAIEIAGRAGLPLKIAAKVDRADLDYFEERIRPLLGEPHVEFVGEISEAEKAEFLSGAHALLFPIDWPEPFGLVMIEAMACGAPVIAFEGGSVREIVEDGVTGFVVCDIAGAVAAVARLSELSRAAVRRRFEGRFTARRMARDYLGLYGRLVGVAWSPRLTLTRQARASGNGAGLTS
jgi:glycosyltransferase involved in cell wall biosynthesis